MPNRVPGTRLMHKSMLLNERRGGEGLVDDGEAGGRETQAREQPRSDTASSPTTAHVWVHTQTRPPPERHAGCPARRNLVHGCMQRPPAPHLAQGLVPVFITNLTSENKERLLIPLKQMKFTPRWNQIKSRI